MEESNCEVAMKCLQDRDPRLVEIRRYDSLARIHDLGSTVSRLRALPRRRWKLRSKSNANRAPWRRRLGKALQSTVTQSVLVIFLVIDLVITATTILQTILNKSRDLKESIALLESCQCTSDFEEIEPWEFLQPMGLSILCVLLLNVLGLLVAFGRSFFTHAGYILDLLILPIAMFLEIYEHSGIAGLFLILNLWRIVMVAHSILEVTEKTTKKHLREAEEQISQLMKSVAQEEEQMQNKIEQLEKAVQEKGSSHANS